MLFPTNIVLLIILGAGAHALPANQDDPTTLNAPSVQERTIEKRGEGSIAAFKAQDCTGAPVDKYRPQDSGTDSCIPFKSGQDNIGINWGNIESTVVVTNLTVYSDDACKAPVGSILKGATVRPKSGTNTCVSQNSFHGPWGSVKYFHEPRCSPSDASGGECSHINTSPLSAREPQGPTTDALALPGSKDDPSNSTSPFDLEERALEKRGMGSIAAFKDPHCFGNPDAKPIPDPGNNDCITMASGTHMIGVNWGNSDNESITRAMAFYKDDKCTVPHSTFTPVRQALVARKGKATNACIQPPPEDNPWHSVQFFH